MRNFTNDNNNAVFEYVIDVIRNDDVEKLIDTWQKQKGVKKLYIRYQNLILKVIIETGDIKTGDIKTIYPSNSEFRYRPLLLTDMQKEDLSFLATAFYYKHYGSK